MPALKMNLICSSATLKYKIGFFPLLNACFRPKNLLASFDSEVCQKTGKTEGQAFMASVVEIKGST